MPCRCAHSARGPGPHARDISGRVATKQETCGSRCASISCTRLSFMTPKSSTRFSRGRAERNRPSCSAAITLCAASSTERRASRLSARDVPAKSFGRRLVGRDGHFEIRVKRSLRPVWRERDYRADARRGGQARALHNPSWPFSRTRAGRSRWLVRKSERRHARERDPLAFRRASLANDVERFGIELGHDDRPSFFDDLRPSPRLWRPTYLREKSRGRDPMGVMTDMAAGTMLVASQRPPIPTSSTAKSTDCSAK